MRTAVERNQRPEDHATYQGAGLGLLDGHIGKTDGLADLRQAGWDAAAQAADQRSAGTDQREPKTERPSESRPRTVSVA